MSIKIPYEHRKDDILRVLVERAREGNTITYKVLGIVLGIPPRGPWKPILDALSLEETKAGRPDITYLVVRARTGYPGQIDFMRAEPLSNEQKASADNKIQDVRDYYRWH